MKEYPFEFAGNTDYGHKRFDLDVGDEIPGHYHGMPHATLIHSGRFQFTDESLKVSYEVGPMAWIGVDARDLHGYRCLESGTIFCIFAGKGAEYL